MIGAAFEQDRRLGLYFMRCDAGLMLQLNAGLMSLTASRDSPVTDWLTGRNIRWTLIPMR